MDSEKRIKKFFNHFFHFFKIPNFVPKKYIKKLRKRWKYYFKSRDSLDDLKIDKDSTLDDLNADGIIDAIEKIISDTKTESANIEKLIANYSEAEKDLYSSENKFESMLNDIINLQNNYDWYGG